MKPLQRKCLVASAFMHGLLVLLVFVGSAFVSKKPPQEAPAFELFDMQAILVDQPNFLSGGNPNVTEPPSSLPPAAPSQAVAQPPPAAPESKPEEPARQEPKEPVKAQQEDPKPEPVKAVESKPEPKPEQPKPRQPDPDSFDLKKAVKKTPEAKPEKAPIKFDFGKAQDRVIKSSASGKQTEDREERSRGEREKQMAQARAGALSDALRRVQGGLSSVGGSYEIPGPGGPAYASYYLALRKFYEDAWIPPNVSRGDEPVVEVEVVIARDGTILSQRILKRAGRRELDNSVQSTLNRVLKAKAPKFPQGSTDEKRTFRINFNLTEKLSVG